MQSQAWQPVVPSHFLRAGDNIVAGYLQGQELALWRSENGAVQAWENRCPHRGTRLTMGRVLNNHLSCAYHGWEFDTQAACAAIPANPDLPLPKQVRVKAFPVLEADGMVWVAPMEFSSSEEDGASSAPSKTNFFCRSMSVRSSVVGVTDELEERGFKPNGRHTWEGILAGQIAAMQCNQVSSKVTLVHVWLQEKPVNTNLANVLGECRLLRRMIEARVISRSQ